jgi:predicted ArsR family transcriptional regulator
VKRLVRDCIDSVEQLEMLLFLRAEAEKDWTADELAGSLYIQAASARNRLESLRDEGLVAASPDKPPRYRYAPKAPGLSSAVDALADAYKVRRVGVINLILEKPMDHIRSFSDAFRF